ncbi:MAG TPA: hypothetical protein VHT00_14245 [Stellaceae bacterium]|jgi:hypothetical protein|nr:hypothetical protein [Stellaceae bacterium]
MGMSVVTVASGGLPVVDVAADVGATFKAGIPVSEAATGVAVTKVASGGTPVLYVTPPLRARSVKPVKQSDEAG